MNNSYLLLLIGFDISYPCVKSFFKNQIPLCLIMQNIEKNVLKRYIFLTKLLKL
jgi:hypothetical protein